MHHKFQFLKNYYVRQRFFEWRDKNMCIRLESCAFEELSSICTRFCFRRVVECVSLCTWHVYVYQLALQILRAVSRRAMYALLARVVRREYITLHVHECASDIIYSTSHRSQCERDEFMSAVQLIIVNQFWFVPVKYYRKLAQRQDAVDLNNCFDCSRLDFFHVNVSISQWKIEICVHWIEVGKNRIELCTSVYSDDRVSIEMNKEKKTDTEYWWMNSVFAASLSIGFISISHIWVWYD